MQLQCSHTRPAFSCILANLFSVLSCFNSRYAYGKFYELLIYFENRRRFVQLPTIFRGLFKITLYGILEHFVLYCLLLSQKVYCEKKMVLRFMILFTDDIIFYLFFIIFILLKTTQSKCMVKPKSISTLPLVILIRYLSTFKIHFYALL